MPRNPIPVEERALQRRFSDPEVIEYLDGLTAEGVCGALNDDPLSRVMFAEGQGYWRQGADRPSLADEDPAVQQAIGRCAASRARHALPHTLPLTEQAHPRPCEWCDYPLEHLLAACDWAVWASRYVTGEVLTWTNDVGLSYHRSGPTGYFENPVHRTFWALPPSVREDRIRAAMYGTVAA